jgi:exopolysaccharide biosynthesis protein YbjH
MPDKRLRAGVAVLAMTTALAPGTIAPAQDAPPRPSLNLYGVTGLIDMPSGEAQPDGQVSANWAMFGNTARTNFTFQFLPWLSGTLRYAKIYEWNLPGEPEEDLFDRSLDLQFQLLEERGRFRPSLALGFRDFLGTGVYSSEYLVATKTVADNVKLTAGLGWGRLSSFGGVENPFCAISDGMCERDEDFGEGGDVAWGRFFRGEEMGIFGGVEWLTPIEGLTLKAEYSSDAYDREQLNSDFRHRSPLNFGAEYRIREGLTVGGYYMYGDTVGVNVVFSGNPKKPLVPQNLDPAPVPVNPRPPGGRGTDWVNDAGAREQVISAVSRVLSDEGITVQTVKFSPTAVDVEIVNRRINQAPKAIGRTARVLAAGMPYSIETFRITPIEGGVPTTTVSMDRSDLERQADQPLAGLESWESVSLAGAQPALTGDDVWRRAVYPLNDWAIVPVPTVQFFGGNEGFRPQLSIEFRDTLRFSQGLSMTGRIRQPILGAYDDPGPDDDPGENETLPPVRSESDRYYAGWQPKLMRLTGDYLFKLNPDTYGRASLGYIERAFAGISTEVLWKPVEQNWGLGAELNYVWQRDFEGLGFGYYDYDVVMGHASVYWDTRWYGIEAQVDAGRYLAGDWGATLTLTRQFANGWTIGAYVTKTNVSSEEFGEGSYDKGILLTIPLRWSTPFETRQEINGDLRSLGSNGGAQLNVANRLYPTVREFDKRRLERSWGQFWQ